MGWRKYKGRPGKNHWGHWEIKDKGRRKSPRHKVSLLLHLYFWILYRSFPLISSSLSHSPPLSPVPHTSCSFLFLFKEKFIRITLTRSLGQSSIQSWVLAPPFFPSNLLLWSVHPLLPSFPRMYFITLSL